MSHENLIPPPLQIGDDASPPILAFVQFLQAAILPVWARCTVFLFFAALLPAISFSFLGHQHRYHLIVQVALSISSAMAFYTLTRKGFHQHFVALSLSRPMSCQKFVNIGVLLLYLLFLSFAIVDLCYRYSHEVHSWVSILIGVADLFCLEYRMVFVLTCSYLFSWTCHLHTLHLKEVVDQLEELPDIPQLLNSQIEMKERLIETSGDYQCFILIGLVGTTILYQISTALWVTQFQQTTNWFSKTEFMLCGACLVCSMFMCLYSASCANSLAHRLAGSAATWHAKTTICSDGSVGPNTTFLAGTEPPPSVGSQSDPSSSLVAPNSALTKNPMPPSMASGYVSTSARDYHRREALVSYMQNNYIGVMAFGLRIDGAWLYGLFTFEVSLILWLLGKTLHF